jgi:hypothetical protein
MLTPLLRLVGLVEDVSPACEVDDDGSKDPQEAPGARETRRLVVPLSMSRAQY